MFHRWMFDLGAALAVCAAAGAVLAGEPASGPAEAAEASQITAGSAAASNVAIARPGSNAAETPPAAGSQAADESWTLLFVLMLATFIGLGVILRVSRLLHTPLMSLTNAISAIAVVGAIIVTGSDHPVGIRILGAVALFASMTNIVSGFLITDRMLRMFKQPRQEPKP